jgi:hypothetical protein
LRIALCSRALLSDARLRSIAPAVAVRDPVGLGRSVPLLLASGPQRGGHFAPFSSHTGTRLPLNHSEPKPLKQMLPTLGSFTRVDNATNHLAAVSRNLLAIDLEATQERGGLGAIERIHPMDVESTCSAERRLTPACFNPAA